MKNIKKILKTVAIAIMLSILVMIFYSVRNVDLSEMPDKKSIAFETTQFSVKLFNPDTTLRFKIDSGFFYVLDSGGWRWGQMLAASDPLYQQATTACLTAIIVTQIANVFACRSFRKSVFSLGLFSNRLIFVAIAVEIAFQLFIVYHPLGNKIFSTYPLPAQVWMILIPFALILFVGEEARKLLARSLE